MIGTFYKFLISNAEICFTNKDFLYPIEGRIVLLFFLQDKVYLNIDKELIEGIMRKAA